MKTDIKEIQYEGVKWFHLAHDRDQWQAFVNMLLNLWVPSNVANFTTSLGPIKLSRRSLLYVVKSQDV